jgi:cytochrome c oxidase assembly protein Cox11
MVEFDSNFDDVELGIYYYEVTAITKKFDIAIGSRNNKFYTKENASRQDMMTMTARIDNQQFLTDC